jgi:hypothetical protein
MAKTIVAALDAYDAWLGTHCRVIADELAEKRRLMAADASAFLRGSCFRFAAQFPKALPELVAKAAVPSCGDAHIENFGTWRDVEGRLVWGVNDLDEAALLPWPCDLVRLATSALLAAEKGASRKALCATIVDAYARALAAPRAFVLDEEHAALREFVAPDAEARAKFWTMLAKLDTATELPPDWRAALVADLPEGAMPQRFVHRKAGIGSLGRPRFAVIAEWGGGRVVREAKARVPSAWLYAAFPGAATTDPLAIRNAPGRAPDPWYRVLPGLFIRRLAPDSRRLAPPEGDAAGLLAQIAAMGAELGNVHATGRQAHVAAAELAAMPAGWLRDAAGAMAALVARDHAALAG